MNLFDPLHCAKLENRSSNSRQGEDEMVLQCICKKVNKFTGGENVK